MILYKIINVIACIIIFLCSLFVLFQHYTNLKSKLEKILNKFEYYIFKFGLIVMSMGTFLTVLLFEEIPLQQVLVNVGLAVYMFWHSVKIYRIFATKTNNEYYAKTVDPKGEEYPDDPK